MYAQNRENLFKKWLIDEIKSKTNSSYRDIIEQVELFSQTEEYQEKFDTWKKIFNKKTFSQDPVQHILASVHVQ